VVSFGGGGLLLLMQPASRQAAIIALANIFIADSSAAINGYAKTQTHFLINIFSVFAASAAAVDHARDCHRLPTIVAAVLQ
jgi:hypothetical protein